MMGTVRCISGELTSSLDGRYVSLPNGNSSDFGRASDAPTKYTKSTPYDRTVAMIVRASSGSNSHTLSSAVVISNLIHFSGQR